MKLTKPQVLNLIHIRDHGLPLPRNRAGYFCRVNGLSEFLWLYEDGSIATTSEKPTKSGCELVKVVGEKLTAAGRRALAEQEERK